MRALELVEIGRMVVSDLPDPVAGPGEVVIRTLFTGICGSDIHGFSGENGRREPGQVMGHESVGRVAAIGEGVDPLSMPLGSLATFNPVVLAPERLTVFEGREQHDPKRQVIGVDPGRVAGFAQLVVVPACNVVLLPDSMPVAYGALVEPLAVALNAARRAGVSAGDTVLVVGGGPIGQSAVLAARHEGASTVYVSELDPARRALCAELGATTIDPMLGSVSAQVTQLHGELLDVAIDAAGASATLQDALESISFGGTVCLVGMAQPQLTLPAFRVSTEERTIVGAFCYSYSGFLDAAEWVGSGEEIFGRLISDEVSLDDAPAVFERLSAHPDVPGKVLVRLSD